MKVNYIWYKNTNLFAILEGWSRDDPMIPVWSSSVELDNGTGLSGILWTIYSLQNKDNRPTAQICPSASLGDAIKLEGQHYPGLYVIREFEFLPANKLTISEFYTWKDFVNSGKVL